jgi:HEAT repeat protein
MEVKAAINELIGMMNDSMKPNEVRSAAAEGLGYAGGPEARASLVKMMKDSMQPNAVKAAAAKALGRAAQA